MGAKLLNQLQLKNPHSILATLEARPKDILRIIGEFKGEESKREKGETAWDEVIRLAKRSGVGISRDPSARLEGPYALVRPREAMYLGDLLQSLKERGRALVLVLDQLQDPQNVGAIFRTAAFFGVDGIVFPEDRSSGLTSVVYDVASGGVEYVPHAVVTNLVRALEELKEAGFWILGSSEHEKKPLGEIAPDRKWALVVGNEEKGIRRLTQEACDEMVSIPCKGKVTSLNVSVATGLMVNHLQNTK